MEAEHAPEGEVEEAAVGEVEEDPVGNPEQESGAAATGEPAAGSSPRPSRAEPTARSRRAGMDFTPEGWDVAQVWSVLFENAPIAYALYNVVTRKALANRKCFELVGVQYQPLVWFEADHIGHPDDKSRGDAMIDRVANGEVDEIEYDLRFLRADGSAFPAHLSASALKDNAGRTWAVLLAVQDLTERVAAERALAASESRFRALVANAWDPIVVVDEHARVTYASPSAERLIGEPVDPHLGEEIFRFCHPEDRPVAVERFAMTLGRPDLNEPVRFRLCRSDGATRYVEVVATNLLHDPAVQGIVINIHDLTDAAEVSSALETTEHRIRRMLENISDTVSLLDRDGTVVLTTGNLRPVMGYPQDYWEGRNGFDIVHPQDMEEAQRIFDLLLSRPGMEMSGELRIEGADGRYLDAEMSAINLLDDPDVEAIVVTSRDITERKRSERELAEARDQAVKALRTRTEFIATVSHELRTPIHGILGLSELLATADLDDDARSLARSIGRATESLRMVLDDILDYSKIEVGRLEINHEPFGIEDMEADIDALFLPQARAKGISLTAEIEPGFPSHIVGDELRIRQVLHNLVGNAIKFTVEGGVHIHLRRERPDPGAPGNGRPPGPRLRLSVRDTGIGIPPEAHGRLFEPFSQAHGSTTRRFGGTGLGLSIAKRLIELMGGELGFASQAGRGSEFWFTLPLVEAPRPPDYAEDGGGVDDGARGGCVLVVEDNPINQLLVRRQLHRLGYDAVVVDTGSAALEAFPDSGAELVLMDWQLPGIDGLETTRRLRNWEASEGRPRTPVVAMTASALPGDRDRCLAAGMDDFIAKPVSMAVLGATVRRWLPDAERAERSDRRGSVRERDGASPSGPGSGSGDGAVETAEDEEQAVAEDAGFDPTALDSLVDELADPALVVTVVRTYLRELPGRVEGIVAAAESGNRSGLVLAAHTLRSTSVAVGATHLAERCRRIEDRLAASGQPGVDADALRRAADAVVVALEAQVSRLQNGTATTGRSAR